VLPDQDLSTETTNTIQLSTDLTFAVTVQNSGCAQEVGIKVRLTIQQSPRPITAQRTIDIIDQGEEETVEFTNLQDRTPQLDQDTSLTVEVEPVPGESNTNNNTASYPVQFSVG
jgi:hypothetical protein